MSLRSWFKWHGEDLLIRPISNIIWPRSSAGVIVIKDEKILALDLGDYLTLPAGGSDAGELLEETAKRETLEETGIEIEIEERITEQINSIGGVEALFRAKKVGGELNGNRVEGEPKWIPLEEAFKRRWRYDRDIESLVEKSSS